MFGIVFLGLIVQLSESTGIPVWVLWLLALLAVLALPGSIFS